MWLRRRWFILLVAASLLALCYVPTGWMIISPGQVLPLSQQVQIHRPDGANPGIERPATGNLPPAGGEVLLLTVAASRANPYQLAAWHAGFMRQTALLAESDMIPPGMSDEDYVDYGYEQMRESVGLASVLALEEAGFDAAASGGGVRVVATGGAADSQALQPGDVISAANGVPVAMSGDLAAVLGVLSPGDAVPISATRGGSGVTLPVRLRQVTAGAEESMLGAMLITVDPSFDLPFPIFVDTREIAGPSGGLAMAIAIYEQLGVEDVLQGRTIAASGYVRSDGSVGPVGGVQFKAIAAAQAGATVLLVAPANGAEARAAGTGLTVVEIVGFRDALDYLRHSSLTSTK